MQEKNRTTGKFRENPGRGEKPEDEITWEDIREGDTVAITLDADGNAVKVTVRSDDLGQGMGQALNSSSTGSIPLAGVYTVDGEDASSEDQTYDSEDANENTVLVTNGGNLTMSGQSSVKPEIRQARMSEFLCRQRCGSGDGEQRDRPQ